MSTATDVVLRPEDQAIRGFELMEQIFTPERREAIAKFLNVGAEDPVLVPYLTVCASYGLDPVMGQIWLIPVKVKVRDGDSQRDEERYRPAVGRDGFLTIARRDPRFMGVQGAVVCERDTFEVEYTGDVMGDPKVLHRFASKPTVFEPGESPDRYRGKVIGAWAKCLIVGQPPQFYFASLREHGRMEQDFRWGQARGERVWLWLDDDGNVTEQNTGKPKMKWAGAWDYVSAMILKAAQSYVLRIGMGITGVAPADEMVLNDEAMQRQVEQAPMGGRAYVNADFDWSRIEAPEELRERLQGAVESVNELTPMAWSPAKIEMVLLGRPVEELEVKAEEIERERELLEERVEASVEGSAEEEDEPGGTVEEAQVVAPEPLSEQERIDLERKRHHAADLNAQLDELEAGSEQHATVSNDLNALDAEIAALEKREKPPAGEKPAE